MRALRALLACVPALMLAAPGSAPAADQWFLLERHGGCFPVRTLERKFQDLDNVSDPDAFVQFVRAKGLKASSRPMPVPSGAAVEVLVPERELSLVFVTAALCPKAEIRDKR